MNTKRVAAITPTPACMKTRILPKFFFDLAFVLSLIVLYPAVVAAQKVTARAPINPAFEAFQAAQRMGTLQTMSADGHALGYIPSPVNLQHTAGQNALVPHLLGSYPVAYDLRALGKVTPVRNQGACGCCWTFGTFASLESCLLPGETGDFSENNLKNTHGFDYGTCDGGDVAMATAYLARWIGPATEAADPYHPWDDRPSPAVPAVKHIQEVLFPSLRASATDNDGIKQAIMTYGAVTSDFYYDDPYYNGATYAYYYNGGNYPNHEIAIVGWDDNFDKSKFASTPPGNGAFIIKNSWGSGWGEAGYFYISYYDTQIGMREMAVFENGEWTSNYTRIYQYDPLGWISGTGYGSTTAWLANVFTAVGTEQLRAIGFYTPAANSSYQIYVYRNPSSPPIGGSPVGSVTGTVAYAGYHTVGLASPASLSAGQQFSVVIKLTTPGYNYPICTEVAIPGYSSGATAAAGQSYISYNGTAWQDVTTWDSTGNVCIKAFSSTASLRVTAINLESNKVRVTWLTSGGQTNVVQATNGDATGRYTNNFTNLSPPYIIPGSSDILTNYLDTSATNLPSRYYRVRLVP